MKELLKAVEALIEAKGLNDDQFARSIGLDPGAWSRKKRGFTKFTKPDLDAMVLTYPELKIPIWQSIGTVDEEPVAKE